MTSSMSIPYIRKVSLPIDCHGQTIQEGNKVVVMKNGMLFPAKVHQLVLKSKQIPISAQKIPSGAVIFYNTTIQEEKDILLQMMEDNSYFSLQITIEYYSIRLILLNHKGEASGKYTTPNYRNIAVTSKN